VQELIGAYQQIVERAHARGVVVIGGTLSPLWQFQLLSSRSAERRRPAGAEYVDSYSRSFRCSGGFRQAAGGSIASCTTAPRV
jgi:hypothetical protein